MVVKLGIVRFFVQHLLLMIVVFALTACGKNVPGGSEQNLDQDTGAELEAAEGSPVGLKTPTPPTESTSGGDSTDIERWLVVTGWEGTFTLSFQQEVVEPDPVLNWPQSVRSSRSASGTVRFDIMDEGIWSGAGMMTWSVDDFLEVQDEEGVSIRSASAQGKGETSLDGEETLLWIDLEDGSYGLAIFPAGLYETMEVQGSEAFEGMEAESVTGPLGQYGLMDTAGISAWFEGRALPESGLVLEGSTELQDGTVFTWDLKSLP
jgi:hypothetical protein